VPTSGAGFFGEFNGPGLAILVYGALAFAALFKAMNHLPGVFALREPLGTVDSGYGHLWLPVAIASIAQFRFTWPLDWVEGKPQYGTIEYGSAIDSWQPAAALAAFVVLMWSVKLHAAMVAANRRLGSGAAA
jgi:hypothetical protein